MTEQAQIIRWEDPPPPALRGRTGGRPTKPPRRPPRPGSRWASVAAELRSNPGRYAVLIEARHPSGLGSQISLGRIRCFLPAGDFEGTTRRIGGIVAVYARYLGDGDEAG